MANRGPKKKLTRGAYVGTYIPHAVHVEFLKIANSQLRSKSFLMRKLIIEFVGKNKVSD